MVEFAEREKYDLITRAFSSHAGSRLVEDDGVSRIYGLKDCSLWAVVGHEDLVFFTRWMWSYTRSPSGKLYIARRAGHGRVRRGGMSFRTPGTQKTLYLHREIMLRTGLEPETPGHKLVDHINGNSLDCRRVNLRWATIHENNKRRIAPGDLS